jgi:hypothetical protein
MKRRRIKYCAIAIIGFIAVAVVFIRFGGGDDDPADFVAMGIFNIDVMLAKSKNECYTKTMKLLKAVVMNDVNVAYRNNPPNPHVHWWLVPRYAQQVVIHAGTSEDPHFGHPYDHYRWQEVVQPLHHLWMCQIVTITRPAFGGCSTNSCASAISSNGNLAAMSSPCQPASRA